MLQRGPVSLEDAIKNAAEGAVILVQNTRCEAGESKNDPELGKYWASLGDVFVEDAFGSVHRAHASTCWNSCTFTKCTWILSLKKKSHILEKAVNDPERPMVTMPAGWT
ncbi:MAG: phosphoglycerate kinase [Thomasclavelia sp.]